MANLKISELTELAATPANDDELEIVDTSAGASKRISVSNLLAGVAAGAPTDAQYVTLATNGTLSAERVLTAGTGISLTDGGAGSTVTVALASGAFGVTSGDSLTSAAGNSAAYTNLTQDRLYYVPIWLPAGTIDRVGTELSGGGSDNHRLGIYANANGRPSGAALVDVTYASTQGVIAVVASLAVASGGWYWLAYVHQGTTHSVLTTHNNSGEGLPMSPMAPMLPMVSGVPFRRYLGYYDSATVSGALPTVGTLTAAGTSALPVPALTVRYA